MKFITNQIKQHGLARYSLRAKAVDFSKILAQIDGMVKVLGNEQDDDDSQKAFCDKVPTRTGRGTGHRGRSGWRGVGALAVVFDDFRYVTKL